MEPAVQARGDPRVPEIPQRRSAHRMGGARRALALGTVGAAWLVALGTAGLGATILGWALPHLVGDRTLVIVASSSWLLGGSAVLAGIVSHRPRSLGVAATGGVIAGLPGIVWATALARDLTLRGWQLAPTDAVRAAILLAPALLPWMAAVFVGLRSATRTSEDPAASAVSPGMRMGGRWLARVPIVVLGFWTVAGWALGPGRPPWSQARAYGTEITGLRREGPSGESAERLVAAGPAGAAALVAVLGFEKSWHRRLGERVSAVSASLVPAFGSLRDVFTRRPMAAESGFVLARLGPPGSARGLAPLIEILQSRKDLLSPEVKSLQLAIRAVVDGLPDGVARLATELNGQGARAPVLEMLAYLGSSASEALPWIRPLLDDSDEQTRIEAAHAVASIDPEGAEAKAAAELLSSLVPTSRGLAGVRARRAVDRLRAMSFAPLGPQSEVSLRSTDWAEAQAGLSALRASLARDGATAAVLRALSEGLPDDSLGMRLDLLKALRGANRVDPGFVPFLQECLSDREPFVRWNAAFALSDMGVRDTALLRCLTELIEGPTSIHRFSGIPRIATFGGAAKNAAPSLRAIVGERSYQSPAAREAIAQIDAE